MKKCIALVVILLPLVLSSLLVAEILRSVTDLEWLESSSWNRLAVSLTILAAFIYVANLALKSRRSLPPVEKIPPSVYCSPDAIPRESQKLEPGRSIHMVIPHKAGTDYVDLLIERTGDEIKLTITTRDLPIPAIRESIEGFVKSSPNSGSIKVTTRGDSVAVTGPGAHIIARQFCCEHMGCHPDQPLEISRG